MFLGQSDGCDRDIAEDVSHGLVAMDDIPGVAVTDLPEVIIIIIRFSFLSDK